MSRRSGCPRSRRRGTRAPDLSGRVERGELPDGAGSGVGRPRKVRGRCARGSGLNKHGRRYKPRAVDDIDEVLRVHVEPRSGTKRISTSAAATFSRWSMSSPELSGSRVRSVVTVASLYRWAQDRELTSHDPAALVSLPAMDATPIERVASPAEFARLLAALEPQDALPYALAGYGMGRRAQIVRLRWPEVDLKVGARVGRRVGGAQVRGLAPRGADRHAACSCYSSAPTWSRGVLKEGLVCPPHAAWASTACSTLAGSPSAQGRYGRSEAPADHAAGSAPYGRDLARCRRGPS